MSQAAEPSRALLLAEEVLGASPAEAALAALREEPVLLAIGPEAAATRRGQVAFAAAATTLGRLFPFVRAVDVCAPAGARVRAAVPGLRAGRWLAGAARDLLASLPLQPREHRHRVVSDPRGYGRALVIGPGPAGAARRAVHVEAHGWIVRAAADGEPLGGAEPAAAGLESPSALGAENPLAAAVAGALGCALVAKGLLAELGLRADHGRRSDLPAWSLWSHGVGHDAEPGPPWPDAVDLGEITVAGLGALGSAVAWALAALPVVRGRALLLDDDRLSPSNLERVLTARASDVGARKAALARRALAGTGLEVRAASRRVGMGDAGLEGSAVVSGVDSGGARRAIAALRPAVVYNGGTQSGELLVSRHAERDGPCLACLYPAPWAPPGAGTSAPVCGSAVPAPELPRATIGFLSALCGFLMAAELVKDRIAPARAAPLDARRPVFRLDVFSTAPGPGCVEAIAPSPGCPCRGA
jgi:molybdopterin/thiamine biosynthesis adenylyltransferase